MSTRSEPGHGDRLAFDDVLLGGLAADGGLYIPEHVPELPEAAGPEAGDQSYAELAARVMAPYVG